MASAFTEWLEDIGEAHSALLCRCYQVFNMFRNLGFASDAIHLGFGPEDSVGVCLRIDGETHAIKCGQAKGAFSLYWEDFSSKAATATQDEILEWIDRHGELNKVSILTFLSERGVLAGCRPLH